MTDHAERRDNIRILRRNGYSVKDLADRYGISTTRVYQICDSDPLLPKNSPAVYPNNVRALSSEEYRDITNLIGMFVGARAMVVVDLELEAGHG